MRPKDAFDVCHEVYVHARQVLDEKLATVNTEFVADGHWRPDTKPRLSEYVADFALAGERALGETTRPMRASPIRARRGAKGAGKLRANPIRASRLVLFRVYYLGGAPYEKARRHLGISELTWSQWTEEIRERVGRELLRAGLYPPGRYFKVMGEP